MTAASSMSTGEPAKAKVLRLRSLAWHRPAWTSSRPQPRWLVFSLVLHVAVITALACSGLLTRTVPTRPKVALMHVLGAELSLINI